jgi:hypothetical protein
VFSDKDSSTWMNAWLQEKPAGILEQIDAVYIADIEAMPAMITRLFALPKMRKYPYRLLLAQDKAFAATYPAKPGKIAVFIIEPDGILWDMKFVNSAEAIEAVVNP